jgi:hypothetical protein
MKTIITLLLSAGLASANPMVVLTGGARAGTTELPEGFEGTGVPNAAWSDISTGGQTVNWDYTAAPIAGAQSVQLTDPPSGTKVFLYNFTQDADEIWFAFRYRESADPAGTVGLVNIIDVGTNGLAVIRIQTNGTLLEMVDAVQGSTVVDLTPGTNYRIKVRYKKGTGANEECQIWAAADSAGAWGTPQQQLNGSSTLRADAIYFQNVPAWNQDQVYDNVIVSTSDIPWSALD